MLTTVMRRFVMIEQIIEYEAEVVVGALVIVDSIGFVGIGTGICRFGARVGDSVTGGVKFSGSIVDIQFLYRSPGICQTWSSVHLEKSHSNIEYIPPCPPYPHVPVLDVAFPLLHEAHSLNGLTSVPHVVHLELQQSEVSSIEFTHLPGISLLQSIFRSSSSALPIGWEKSLCFPTHD